MQTTSNLAKKTSILLSQDSNPIKVSHISPFKSRLTYLNNEYTVFIQYASYILCCIQKNIYNENIIIR